MAEHWLHIYLEIYFLRFIFEAKQTPLAKRFRMREFVFLFVIHGLFLAEKIENKVYVKSNFCLGQNKQFLYPNSEVFYRG